MQYYTPYIHIEEEKVYTMKKTDARGFFQLGFFPQGLFFQYFFNVDYSQAIS